MSNKPEVTNARMSQFIVTTVDQVRETLEERSDDILKAWQETVQESVDGGDDFPKLKVAFGTVVDLEANKIETTLRFTCAYKSTISTPIEDPNQTELPL